jgi:hypothetical protein
MVRGNEVKVSGFISKDSRSPNESSYNNLYVRGFPDSFDSDEIRKVFA